MAQAPLHSLLHAPTFDPGPIVEALHAEGIERRTILGANELRVRSGATVLVLDAAARDRFPATALTGFHESGGGVVALAAPAEKDIPDELSGLAIDSWLPHRPGQRQLLLAIRTACQGAVARSEILKARQEAAIRTRELTELTHIGAALATERDLAKLLRMILSQARRVTHADAASLYLVEDRPDGERRLRFELAQNHSLEGLDVGSFSIPLDPTSIAGYVASTGEPVVVDDAYELGPDAPYKINRSFDRQHGYYTRSVLALPMQNPQGEVIGVLQLINRKRDFKKRLRKPREFETQVVPFDRRSLDLVLPFAGQAAISLENSQLYASIERLFEGFVTAAVTAIEQRDPTTSGHSVRVAGMTVELAKTLDGLDEGPFRELRFSREQLKEIRYAGLLHDFGKVGVREQVLVKAKKLYPEQLDRIRNRYAYIRQHAELELARRRIEHLELHGREGYDQAMTTFETEHVTRLAALDRLLDLVLEANEPTVVPEGTFAELRRLAGGEWIDFDGGVRPLVEAGALTSLTVRQGSLDEAERLEIESHVDHTYRFLKQIPWTRELAQVPDIAYGHHEKLNGRGYPRSIRADEIPVQTRMMTIADIYDALTAADRPYKRAVTRERALDILRSEVEGDMLDPDLFQIFVGAKIYQTP